MKKITALLLCFVLLCAASLPAFAAGTESETANTVISLSVPDSHKITVQADNAKVFFQGVSGEEFQVERLCAPRLLIRAESGKRLQSVTLNGQDVTAKLQGGYLEVDPVYEDKLLVVTTTDEPAAPEDGTYTVKGRVTLNGQPLANADLELRSVLQTTKTAQDGSFVFTDVEPGKHSLTALSEGKIIGYLSFEVKPGNRPDIALQEDGSYTVFLDRETAGVELHLVLNEEAGVLAPTEAASVQKPTTPGTGDPVPVRLWMFLLLASVACIVVLETYRRKKTV